PLDISGSSQMTAYKDSSLPTEVGSLNDMNNGCTKNTRFVWRDLLDPEFYPEITVRRTSFFLLWIIPHIIITIYASTDKTRTLINRMNLASKMSILFDVACILIFMSPTFMLLLQHTFLPRIVRLEKNIHAHKVAAYTLLFWAALHV
ncbi:hypothetical protein EC988_009999, partial [Linderina pennispora]